MEPKLIQSRVCVCVRFTENSGEGISCLHCEKVVCADFKPICVFIRSRDCSKFSFGNRKGLLEH